MTADDDDDETVGKICQLGAQMFLPNFYSHSKIEMIMILLVLLMLMLMLMFTIMANDERVCLV